MEKKRTLTFVGSGKYSDVFKVRDGRRSVIMKLSYYRDDTLCRFVKAAKQGDLQSAARAKNTDSISVSANFARASNDLVVRGVSPHFVVVYCDMDCKNFAARLKELLPERFRAMSAVQMKYNNMCFMEVFGSNLTAWLTRGRYSETALRGVLFQVLYTLAALQKVLPGFRHNDLSSNNVLVKTLPRAVTYGYSFEGRSYVVRSRLLVGLSDYDFTHVPGHPSLQNERVLNGRYKVDGSRNPSYDPHFFLKSVAKALTLRQAKFPETMAFLKSIGMRSDLDRLDAPIPGFTPARLLTHAYFAPLASRGGTAGVDVVSAA